MSRRTKFRSSVTFLLLAYFVTTAVAQARKPRTTLRAHSEANAQDGSSFSSPVKSTTTGKGLVIQKVPIISEHDVVSFAPYRSTDGTYGALFTLDDHGKLALDTLSIERRGTYLYVFVNGRNTAELLIDRRVSDGKLYLPSGLTEKDVTQMKKDWPKKEQRKK